MYKRQEKKEYYFKLIDELASIKINGIIVEFEDKLGYERRPTIAAPDSYSISWWKSLSEYANERNIKISPLIQGLGHASFILKHDKYKKLRDSGKSLVGTGADERTSKIIKIKK